MTETPKTRFLFKRSEINPKLEDVELEVELTPEELNLVFEIKSLQDLEQISHGVTSGSTWIREYKTKHAVPFGYGLVKPRGDLLDTFRSTRDFISGHIEGITSQTPDCTPIVGEILSRLDNILGTE
jgi:hypothetical protein